MIFLRRPWFEARSLGALQVYLEQPLKKPLPDFEARLLRGAVNLTMRDRGTPIDAAFRFYAAYAKTALENGRNLNEIKIGLVSGRLLALQNRLKFYREHIEALKSIGALAQRLSAPK